MILPLIGAVAGFLVVYRMGVTVPFGYANYLAVAVLATLDSLVGGWRGGMEHHFDREIFLSGFFVNAIVAGLLAFFGDKIGVPLTTVATIVFGYRIFNNLSMIRVHWVARMRNRSPELLMAGTFPDASLGANVRRVP
jgi:small basic protein